MDLPHIIGIDNDIQDARESTRNTSLIIIRYKSHDVKIPSHNERFLVLIAKMRPTPQGRILCPHHGQNHIDLISSTLLPASCPKGYAEECTPLEL
jgi:hypothetical protein